VLTIGSVKKARRKNKIIFLASFLLLSTLLFSDFQEFFISVKALSVEPLSIEGRLTIPSPINVNLTIYVDDELCPSTPKPYCLGERVNISNKLENIGGFNVSGDLFTKILNSSNYVINQTDWLDVNVSAGETVYKNTSYTIREEDERGIFDIISNYSYDVKYSFASCNFWVYKGIGDLLTSKLPVFFIPPGKSRNNTLDMVLTYACDIATVKMNASSNAPGDWTSFDPEQFLLFPDRVIKRTNVTVTVPMDTDLGPYYGSIYANADGEREQVNLTVVVTLIDFYLKTIIPPDKKEVCQGSDVYAEVNITKIAPPGQIDFNMTYQLLHEGNLIAEFKEENLFLNDTFNSTIRVPVLKVPSDAPTGDYTFLSHLDYVNQTDRVFYESADGFTVKYCPPPVTTTPSGAGGGGGGGGKTLPKTEKQLILNLSTNLLSVTTGNRTSFVATVENTGNTAVKDVKISIKGISSDWIEAIPSFVTIPDKGTQGYLIIINVPSNAKAGVYQLEVKATDDVESNSENLTLVIGKNIKEIADLMLIEFQKLLKEATQSLLVEDCLDVTFIKIMHEDARLAFEKGLEEYEKKNYVQAINWFEYAIPLEQKVISRIDISIEMELLASNSSKIIIPPFYDAEEQFIRAEAYLEEKNYEEICDPIEEIRKSILVGLIFWPGILLIIVFVVIVLVFFYKYKRRRERHRIIEEVRKRLISET